MTADQLALLYFGLPLAVLGIGLRHGMGTRSSLLVVPLCLLVAGYGLGVEWMARQLGLDLPAPVRVGNGPTRSLAPFVVFSVLLGAYGAAMVRFRRRGNDPDSR